MERDMIEDRGICSDWLNPDNGSIVFKDMAKYWMSEYEKLSKRLPDVTERPTWTEYWMNIALATSLRSTCIRRKFGSVIISPTNQLVGLGYNGSARGEVNCCDRGTCKRADLGIPSGERYELCVAEHSESNSIASSSRNDMIGATIYVAGYNIDGSYAASKPCLMCQRKIKNAQIATVVYLDADGTVKSYNVKESKIDG